MYMLGLLLKLVYKKMQGGGFEENVLCQEEVGWGGFRGLLVTDVYEKANEKFEITVYMLSRRLNDLGQL